jgi:hypothetical protein
MDVRIILLTPIRCTLSPRKTDGDCSVHRPADLDVSTSVLPDSLPTQYSEQMREDLANRRIGGSAERIWTKLRRGESKGYTICKGEPI